MLRPLAVGDSLWRRVGGREGIVVVFSVLFCLS